MATGFSLETGYAGLDNLSHSGMTSMLTTVLLHHRRWLLAACSVHGIVDPIAATGGEGRQMDRSLVAATGLTSIAMNIVAGDQYMSIVLPGRMLRKCPTRKLIRPETLFPRVGGIWHHHLPLVPWNSCGAYMAAS